MDAGICGIIESRSVPEILMLLFKEHASNQTIYLIEESIVRRK